ncbi:MAG TPA: GMC family oxidoreductase N-terminal domain-containing protein [Roseiflexaceae bacterium]|nr:GMC family oxidoreductase N-terminal domain-containing protein [Roseiflexaceae bacterium]
MAHQRSPTAGVIVVGSGPGGATVARELARGGRRVLLLERGQDHRGTPWYGTYLGALLYIDRGSLLFTREGLQIVRPLMVGGATSMYCGCAAPPPTWLASRYGVDVAREVTETVAELGVAPLPPELRGPASTRIAMAGRALGQDWQPQLKFMRLGQCEEARAGSGSSGTLTPATAADAARGGSYPPRITTPATGEVGNFACGAHCMLGCRCGAKWSAAEFVDDAVAAGAELRTGARVERVLLEDGCAVGVAGTLGGRPFTARASTVVLAAGGIGTPRILQASGFREAGQGATMDATLMVYGVARGPGIGSEPPMTWAWHDEQQDLMLSTLIDPWLLYPITAALAGPRRLLSWARYGSTLGVMIKLRDELSGGVGPRTISKPLGRRDRERLAYAQEAAERLLREAGCDPASIFATPLRGTHPGSTARIGALVDADLQAEARGLYVCDASAFPEALGRPTVLTLIGMGKRLGRRLLAGGRP